eukprot:12385434-Alexandrium_andersonii.AAC.1
MGTPAMSNITRFANIRAAVCEVSSAQGTRPRQPEKPQAQVKKCSLTAGPGGRWGPTKSITGTPKGPAYSRERCTLATSGRA